MTQKAYLPQCIYATLMPIWKWIQSPCVFHKKEAICPSLARRSPRS